MDSSGQKIINPIKKVIIDTDPGIDDAMAIMLALSAHKKQTVEVVAITLVSGNSDTDNAKVNILRVLETNGLEDEIPVYVGANEGLVEKYEHIEPPYHGVDGFGNTKFDKHPDISKIRTDEPACIAMLRIVKQFSGSITLVALGPLTNVAACINVDPSFITHLNSIMLMGGNSHGEGNVTACGEFNFHADPEAAKVVIDRAACPVYITPWETCKNINITWDWRQNVLAKIDSPQIHLLNRIEEMWYDTRRSGDAWIPCDQVTMSIFLDQTIIRDSDTFEATVELHGSHTRGQLVLDKRNKNLANSHNKSDLNQTANGVKSQHAGVVIMVLSVDVEKLKRCLIRELSHQ